MAACALLCVLLLTGCTKEVTVIQDIPTQYFSCKSWPQKPPKDATDHDSGVFIIEAHAAWYSCKESLSKLKNLKTATNR